MNKLLQSQLQKHFGGAGKVPEKLTKLLNTISKSYDHYEKDRKMIERSIELSSKEMIKLNSQLKSEKDELKKAHKELKTLFEGIDEILYSVDMVSLKMIQISVACEKVYGYTPAEFFADQNLWQNVVLPEDIDIVHQRIKELYEGKQVAAQYRIIHKDKSIRWLESKIIPTLDDAGQLIRIDGVTNDITTRKRAEKALETSVSILEATIESTADGILVADFNGKIVQFNKKFVELWGIPREILDQKDDEKALAFVVDQLNNPEEFFSKVKELYVQREAASFDILKFKDGRTLERYSQPQLIEGKCVGRVWSFRDMTESRKAEDKIKESELRYRSVIEQATDAICIADASMKIMDINPSGCQLLGYSKEDFLQLSVADLFLLEDLETNPFKIDELKSGKTIRNERRFKRKDGTMVDVEVNGKILADGRFLVFGRDISERKQAEKLLKESELRYRSLIEQASDAICIADASLKFIDMNPYACQVLGYSIEEALSLSVSDIIFIEDLKTNPLKFDEVKPKEIIRNERRFKRKDGASVIMEVSTQLMEDGRFIMFGHDISERKKAESVLKENEGQLSVATQIAKLGYWEFDVALNLFKFNDQFYSMFKTTAEKVGGYTMSSERYAGLFVHPDDISIVTRAAVETIKSPDPHYNNQIEHRIKYANGETGYMVFRFFIVKNEKGRTVKTFGAIQDITESKKAEEALTNNELKFRTLASNAPVGIFQTDASGKTIYVNETWLRYTGMEIHEAIGDGWMTAVHPDDRDGLIEDWSNKSQKGIKSSSEYRLVDKKGNTLWVSGEAIPLFNTVREITGYIGTLSDITERKNAEAVLKRNEGQLSIATQIAKLGYWEFDVINGMFTFNDQFYSIYKTTAEKMGGYTMSPERYAALFVHPDDIPMVGKEVADAINSTDPHYSRQVEHRIIDADGVAGHVAVRFFIVKDEHGHTVKTYGANQDITERKKAEAEIRSSDKRYRQIVETAQEGIWLIDENKVTVFVNRKMAEILEYSIEEMIGKKIFCFMDKEWKKKASEDIIRRKNETHDFRYITKSGKDVWTNLSTNPVFDDAGIYKGALAMVTDITLRKQQEELLLKSEAKLEMKNKELEGKNKELEQFAYVASHDMQEPLRTTSSFVELLQKQYKGRLDENADKYLTFISQSSDRMKVLIKDLLDYSRIGRKKELAEIDCNVMLNEVLADLGQAINESGAVIKTENLPVISGYPTEIKQLFQNLIMNAIKFRKQDTAPEINIRIQKKGSHWEFGVKDNGIGIEEQHRERIFIIFQRLHTRNEYEGSGIGLAHCKKIVELHGGKIWVESKPGEGTTFRFTTLKNYN